ncbi:MAG: hypothetical protein QG597_1880, partial [Actinomycetota bacterium]|nr:hypothetical protein [Actinomycetota bacterium]
GRREPGLDSLGWSAALDVYRPFLSYDELSAVFAERSKMYSALAPILGLERLEDAQQRLRTVEKSLSIPKDAAAAIVRDLRPAVEALDDPRARAVHAQLRRRRPDLEALRALVTTGTSPADGGLDRLRTLAASSAPDPALFDQARDRFLQARNALEGLERSAQVADIRRRDLLAAALAVQRADGEGPCPVCGVGVLDHDWARRTETELLRQRELAASRVDAHQELDAAVRALTAVTGPPPTALAALRRDPIPDLPDGLTEQCANLLSAWQAWHALAEAPDRLARDGRVALDELHSVADVVSQAARDELARREDQWQPLALRVAEWLGHAERAATVQDRLATVKTASAWFKRNTHELRNDRIRPLTERARHVWSLLRQGSSVELGEITLAGSNNSRRVELLAAVGESQAEALGVMSQGELHALALALFLPKATAPDSPFGFVVIDDPVQAMDPAKVDGLARALEEAASDRQVVALTHDDRLPEAVRRLGIEARILEVVRDHGSRITVTNAVDPAFRYLDDARAVARDEKLPDPVRRKVVAALCRMAAEARSRDVFFARRLSIGAGRTDVERVWSGARRTRQKVALAVKDDAEADLGSWLSSRSHGPALTACSSRSHDGVTGDVCGAVEAVAHLVRDLGGHHGR